MKKNTSGKHVSPRRKISDSPDNFEAQDDAARARNLTWIEWARETLRVAASDHLFRKRTR